MRNEKNDFYLCFTISAQCLGWFGLSGFDWLYWLDANLKVHWWKSFFFFFQFFIHIEAKFQKKSYVQEALKIVPTQCASIGVVEQTVLAACCLCTTLSLNKTKISLGSFGNYFEIFFSSCPQLESFTSLVRLISLLWHLKTLTT